MAVSKIFKREFQVARVSGIPVRIDFRWFIVFALSVWLIAGALQRTELREASLPITQDMLRDSEILGQFADGPKSLVALAGGLRHGISRRLRSARA